METTTTKAQTMPHTSLPLVSTKEIEGTTQQFTETTQSLLTTNRVESTITTETKKPTEEPITINSTNSQSTSSTQNETTYYWTATTSTLTDINTNHPNTGEPTTINPTDSQQTTNTTPIRATTISNPSLFMDFCPGVGKNIDCANGDFIYLTDAFYGISSETPAVCAFK